MIERITIKNIATYDNEGVELDNLKKVNFIYGANGSGKTTISNVLDSFVSFHDKGCEIAWKNNTPLKVVAYNRYFREQHFNKGKIPGVFTLGSATKEEIDEIERLNVDIEKVKTNGSQLKTTIGKQAIEKENLEVAFQESCWSDIYKKNQQLFKEAFKGCISSKINFAEKVKQEYKSAKGQTRTIDELKDKAKTIFGEAPQQMSEISFTSYSRLIEIENNAIWQKKIIGKSDVEIAKLIQRLNLNDWVNQGRQYIEESSDICPFCQKSTIDKTFMNQLEEYFDEVFTSDTKLIKELYIEYNSLAQNTSNILQHIEKEEAAKKTTKLDLQLFVAHLKTFNQQISANNELLNNKLKEPSRSIELISLKEQIELICELISLANIEIKKHNIIVNDFQVEKTNLVSDVWKFIIEENRKALEIFDKRMIGLQVGLDKLEKVRTRLLDRYRELNKQIKAANKNVTSVQPSVDAINDTLAAYGFDNFKIVPSKEEPNHYQIDREDGSTAEKTLSEGEITFISFLYYLQLAKGGLSGDAVAEDRILVVDDPISSLDSTVLFVVSSLLKEIIKEIRKNNNRNIKQLILLTHNVYFHKEVSFFDGRKNQINDVNFWILRKCNNTTKVQDFGDKNPIRGSYQLLWDELKNKDKLSRITIQNTMRRIIETYFKTMGVYTDDNLIKSFNNKQEQEICRSLICWVNDGSHCIADDLHVEHQDTISDKYFDVFYAVFVNTNHTEHYNMMMGISTEEQV